MVQQVVKAKLLPVLKAKAAAASLKKSATPDDGINDLAEAIAFGVAAGLSDPALIAAISGVIVPPVGGPVGTMLSAAIKAQSTATPPVL